MLQNRNLVTNVLRRLSVISAGTGTAVCRASMSSAPGPGRQVAVVGGGVSGLYCAHHLTQHGYAVTVFDLGKNCPGGRLTTRRTSWKGLQFDHGCQFIRPVSETFKHICQEWQSAGVIAPWEGPVVRYEALTGSITDRRQYTQQQQQQQQQQQDKQQQDQLDSQGFLDVLAAGDLYVGLPSSDAVTNHLASTGATIRNDVKVSKAAYDSSTGKWLLEGSSRQPMRLRSELKQQPPYTPWNLGVFDGLVLADKMIGTTGSPGFIELQGSTAGLKMLSAMSGVGSVPVLALLLGYQPVEATMAAAAEQGLLGAAAAQAVLQLPFDAAAVVNSDEIQWICVDSNKPGRSRSDGCQTVVALATPEFSESLIQRSPDGSLPPQTPELLAQMVPHMFAALQKTLRPLLADKQGKLHEPAFVQVHRWGSAFPARPFGSPCLTADSAHLAACGDFCLGAGVENAVLSGRAAAEAMISMLDGKKEKEQQQQQQQQ